MIAAIATAYERLFVAFYGWSLKVDGGPHGAYSVYFATLMLGLALLLNAAALLIGLELIFGWPLIPEYQDSSLVWWIAAVAAYYGLQFLYFHWQGRYRKLIVRHAGSEQLLAKTKSAPILVYMVSSLVVVILLFLITTATAH